METITAEQKAKELVDKFLPLVNEWEDVPEDSSSNRLAIRKPGIDTIKAKKCAQISVDEILKIVTPILAAFETESDGYWEKVKEEIIKL